MLDRKKLSEVQQAALDNISVKDQVIIWETMCLGCPDKLIQTKRGSEITEHLDYKDALDMASSFVTILRGCKYDDQEFTLKEITSNTCRFWTATTCEKEDDVE